MTDEPSLSELRRRMEELRAETRASFQSLGERLDKMPTLEVLTLHLRSTQQSVEVVRDELKRVERTTERRMDEIEKAAEGAATERKADRKWIIATALTTAAVMIGLAGFILSVVQP